VAIYIGRRLVWRASNRHVRVVSRVRWSRSRHALAFVTRNRRGAVTLEVVLMRGHTRGHNMSWPIPARLSRFRRAPSVTWLNERRVAFGRSAIRPDLVASWRVAK
jgi:hypothetical protein